MRIDTDVRVHWPKIEKILNCEFSDLFENNMEITLPASFSKKPLIYGSWRLLVLPDDQLPEYFSNINPRCAVELQDT
ncbi:MAG: hypothetical protein KJ573_09825, partial [Proteobacteria bacterium]|nr:hypothetical protein [Pseudomonadota bacterium]